MSICGVHEHTPGGCLLLTQERQPTAVVRHLLLRPDGLFAMRSVAPAPREKGVTMLGTGVAPRTDAPSG
jgi:hypothetical protein